MKKFKIEMKRNFWGDMTIFVTSKDFSYYRQLSFDNVEQATAIRDALTEWIDNQENERSVRE